MLAYSSVLSDFDSITRVNAEFEKIECSKIAAFFKKALQAFGLFGVIYKCFAIKEFYGVIKVFNSSSQGILWLTDAH